MIVTIRGTDTAMMKDITDVMNETGVLGLLLEGKESVMGAGDLPPLQTIVGVLVSGPLPVIRVGACRAIVAPVIIAAHQDGARK